MDRRAFLSSAAACSVLSGSAQAQAPPPRFPRFGAAAVYSAAHDGVSFLVVRNGIVLAEDYPGASADARWPLGAGTRVFAGLLAASLVEDELMNLDEPASMTLGDWGLDPFKNGISVRSVLNGTSGIAFGDNPARDAFNAIALRPVAAPGERFIDDPASYVLMMEIARRKLALSGRFNPDPAIYLTERTLSPIGCTPIGWTRTSDGAPLLHDGAVVSARGWAQAGELIRRDGIWRAEQLVDGNAARETLRGTFAESRAGIGLWLAAPPRSGAETLRVDSDLWRGASSAPFDLAMAAGDGGQRLYIIPSAHMIIVRQSRNGDANAEWSDSEFLSLLLRDLERSGAGSDQQAGH